MGLDRAAKARKQEHPGGATLKVKKGHHHGLQNTNMILWASKVRKKKKGVCMEAICMLSSICKEV